jgi:tetratricopeptide (TPR) repeat protein
VIGSLLVVFLSSSPAGAKEKAPADKDVVFSTAVDNLQKENYVAAANSAWQFLQVSNADDPRFDRGQRLLTQSAEGLELNWAAAMLYRDIAKARRNVELLPDALLGLERIVQSGVYDEDMLVTSFIASEDFGHMPPEVDGFVHFYKGLDLARRGKDEWAQVHFDAIEETSPYWARAQYVHAVRLVADGDYAAAIRELEALRLRQNVHEDQAQEIVRSLARIAFDEQRYQDALGYYESLQELAPDDPDILLEMAWTHFYLGDARKTLGLIVALDAPVHQEFISPARYLLEALALRRLCQFGAAREAAVRLERRYNGVLQDISKGLLPREIPELVAAARLRGRSQPNAEVMRSLAVEREVVRSSHFDPALKRYLTDLYDRGQDEVDRRESELIGRDVDALTEELLWANEGVRLIVHELGVSLLRGRRRPPGAVEKPQVEVPLTGERVFFEFEGEYWTDELDDLIVVAEDRCVD